MGLFVYWFFIVVYVDYEKYENYEIHTNYNKCCRQYKKHCITRCFFSF